MRILHIVSSFNFGGAENHVRDLANAMQDMGNEVFIMSKKGMQSDRLNKGIHFSTLKITDILVPFLIISICIFLKKNRIDVIHAHKRLSIFIAVVAGRIMKIPVIVTVHGRPRYDLRSAISKKYADRIIFVSVRTIKNNPIYERVKYKSVYIQNGVEVLETKSDKDPYSIFYISRVDKRHSYVLSLLISEVLPVILSDFPKVTLNIVGDGSYLENLRIKALEINDKYKRDVCILHGFITEVKPLIQQSGIVLGVGRVAMEALSCAVPVLSVNRNFMGQIVDEQNYMFYQMNNFVASGHEAPDKYSLTKSLKEYFNNPGYYQEKAKILQGYIKENLSIVKISGKILDLYREEIK